MGGPWGRRSTGGVIQDLLQPGGHHRLVAARPTRVEQADTQQVTQLEHHRQATAQVTVGKIITSMRLISSLDWRTFVESVSLVDPILAEDPAGIYPRMNFATRDRYRHAIERISKRTKVGEIDVVTKAVELARRAKEIDPRETVKSHVGYFLIGEGQPEFEGFFKYRPRLVERHLRFSQRHPTLVYLGSLFTLTGLLLYPVLHYLWTSGGSLFALIAFGCLALLPASELALSLLNHYITCARQR